VPSTTPAIERREIKAEGVCDAAPRIQANPELKAQPKTALLNWFMHDKRQSHTNSTVTGWKTNIFERLVTLILF